MDNFEHSDQFDAIVTNLMSVPPPPLPVTLTTSTPVTLIPSTQESAAKDLSLIYREISYNELKSAALTLGNKNTLFDLNWEYFLGQFQSGVSALVNQNVDTSALMVLSNIAEHLRAELAQVRTSTYYCLLFLIDDRDREELEKKRKTNAARVRATDRANKKRAEEAEEEKKKKQQQQQQQQQKQQRQSKTTTQVTSTPPQPAKKRNRVKSEDAVSPSKKGKQQNITAI